MSHGLVLKLCFLLVIHLPARMASEEDLPAPVSFDCGDFADSDSSALPPRVEDNKSDSDNDPTCSVLPLVLDDSDDEWPADKH